VSIAPGECSCRVGGGGVDRNARTDPRAGVALDGVCVELDRPNFKKVLLHGIFDPKLVGVCEPRRPGRPSASASYGAPTTVSVRGRDDSGSMPDSVMSSVSM